MFGIVHCIIYIFISGVHHAYQHISDNGKVQRNESSILRQQMTQKFTGTVLKHYSSTFPERQTKTTKILAMIAGFWADIRTRDLTSARQEWLNVRSLRPVPVASNGRMLCRSFGICFILMLYAIY